ncbi:lytic transglycosylase domain-containing protein [Meinhardsimonia xiamenensis]|jgi:soluble lytic murein transglycosylase-like protein|nr:lytic transglycosylase domain-containing protein [Meinhardsimonia xiamenensis]
MALLTVLVSAPNPASAWAATCERAARRAAAAYGVPDRVLQAIALAESGRPLGQRFGPWPWTVNAAGEGHWFESRREALDFARALHARGERNLDLGCFQINYRWHGSAFSSMAEMFDPVASAMYAARFLKQLHRETGDWVTAAGAYHSRKEVHASRYRNRFRAILARFEVPASTQGDPPAGSTDRTLQGNATGPLLSSARAHEPRLGSLVPLVQQGPMPLVQGLKP